MTPAGGPAPASGGRAVTYRAAWVLPVETVPVRDAWVTVAAGRVQSYGTGRPPVPRARVEDLGRVAILPGLVNAHTHLELSGLRGRVPPSASMSGWAARLIECRRQAGQDDEAAIAAAVRELRAAGTAAVGDVSNTLASVAPLAAGRIEAVVFHELLGFDVEDGREAIRRARERAARVPDSRVRVSVAPHAPYSVSPALLAAIVEELRAAGGPPTTIHLAESREEIEFLRHGTGPWRQLLENLGSWRDGWMPPACGPVEYLDRLGFLSCRPLVVHGIHLDGADLTRLAAAGATVVTCPRSAEWTGAGTPPLDRFYASGVPVAVGTDSLASAPDLNLFAELAAIRRLAPAVPASRILDSATRQGARALGVAAGWGTIAAGRLAELLAVPIPAGVEDVEEYLVRGVAPDELTWLEGDVRPS